VTTTSSAITVPFRQNRLLHVLCALFFLVVLSSLLRASDAGNWMLENIAVVFWIGLFAFAYHRLTLSDCSYVCLFVFFCAHEFGAQYTYAKTPLGEWMKPLFHTTRNDYDRLVHFLAGLLGAYVWREVLLRSVGVKGRWVYRLPVLVIAGFAAIYEMCEAWVAVLSSGDTDASSFLGLQGDPWDSQKDMFASTLGAGITMAALFLRDYLVPSRRAKLRQD
jgi:putative membrane protein